MTHALIIDDNKFNLEVLARMLAMEGGTHTAVQDVALLENELEAVQQVDVVFLDLEMPKKDGYQMLEILREMLGNAVPIVAYTVYANEINNARDVGFDGFIGKPLDPQRFPDQLHRILSGEQVWELA